MFSFLGPDGREQLRQAGGLLAMGLEPVVGFVGGRWLDGVFGTGSVLQWVGLVLGLAALVLGWVRLVQRIKRNEAIDEEGA